MNILRLLRRLATTGCMLSLFGFSGATFVLGASPTEKAGDALQAVIPASALIASYCLHDQVGQHQFYKSYLANFVITYTMKYIIDKPRPEGHGQYSFPSGHTSAAFQGAAFIQKRYGWKYGLPAYLGAAFVGWSRVEAKRHDWMDVTAGATLGLFCSYFFATPLKKVTAAPVTTRGMTGVKIVIEW